MQNRVITFEPLGDDMFNVVYTKELTPINPKTQTAVLEKIAQREPYNFEVALELSKRYADNGDHERACEVRFRAASEAIEALPEDEEYMELDWEDEENQEFIEIITASGTDLYMHGDFEMAAALYETALSLDSQDHLDIASSLALAYIAIEDWDGYESLKNDFVQGSMIEALVENFAAFRQNTKPKTKLPQELIAEIIATEHEISDTFLAEVDKERVSKNVAAREIWYRHLPIFEVYPQFTAQFR